jgi:hypothetical protein
MSWLEILKQRKADVKAESYIGEVMLLNQQGREFLVKHFISPDGYTVRGIKAMCEKCRTTPAIYRSEIYDHVFNPIGSEYYCVSCLPETANSRAE